MIMAILVVWFGKWIYWTLNCLIYGLLHIL
jgi:hypothetical protein